jgi:hypothetical protein
MNTLMPFNYSNPRVARRRPPLAGGQKPPVPAHGQTLGGQIRRNLLFSSHRMSTVCRRQGICVAVLLLSALVGARAQTVAPQGGEFPILGPRNGDQVLPSLSLSSTESVLTWQDPFVDGAGQGIGMTILDDNFKAQTIFAANKTATGDQIKPQVKLLRNGLTIVVWESKVLGTPDVFARLWKGNKPLTADIRVNTYLVDQQIDPVVDALPDGGAVIVWASYGQDGSLWGVYARKLTSAGVGATTKEFLVNQYTTYNQRNPSVTALANGNYVIAWVSEQQRFAGSADVFARVFSSGGMPLTDEILINSGANKCASPTVAPLSSGGFTVAWSQKDTVLTNSWDVWGRAFSASGTPMGADFRINTYLYGDQYRPKLASGPNGILAVWTSMGEDGSKEGVFGRYLLGGVEPSGPEFQVNTTIASSQIHPAVAWDGVGHFLVVWSSFNGTSGFDLFGQEYVLAGAANPAVVAKKPAGVAKP